MDSEQLSALLLLVFFLLVYGILSGVQGALFSITDEDLNRARGAGDRRSRLLRKLLLSPRQTSLSLLIGRRLALLGAIGAGTWTWLFLQGRLSPLGVLICLPPLAILSGSFISRGVLLQEPLLYAYRLAIPLWIFHKGVYPLRWGLQRATGALLALMAIPSPWRDEEALEREYLGLLEMGHREGVVESDEHRMIHRVFEFGDQPVSKVMTPRTDMFTLPMEMGLEEVIRRVKEAGYSRIPVYLRKKEEIAGILYAKDLLRLRPPNGHSGPRSLGDILHEIYFVPTHMIIDKLLREFQRRKLHMAICVDEYGGVAGLVTMENLLEELFGEIYDEYDLETRQWESMGEGVYLVSGRMDLDDLEDLLQVKIEEPDCQTLAGLVLKLFGRVPHRSESTDHRGLRFVVEKVAGMRIQAVRIEKLREEGV